MESNSDFNIQKQTFFRDFAEDKLVSLEQIKMLMKFTFQNPVISFYLNLTPETIKGKNYVSAFNSLVKDAFNKYKDYIATLNKKQLEQLKKDIQDIREFLDTRFKPGGLRTLAVFKSGRQLQFVLHLPVRAYHPNEVIIDTDPYLVPILGLLHKEFKTLVIHVAKDKTVLYRYHLGILEKIKKIEHGLLRITKVSIKDEEQKRQKTLLHRYLKEVVNIIVNLQLHEHFNKIILMGTKDITEIFEDILPQHLHNRIIGVIPVKPEITEGQLKNEVEQAFNNFMYKMEQQELKKIQSLAAKDKLLTGITEVIGLLNVFNVKKLWVSTNLDVKGYVCTNHDFMSLQGGKCPYCDKELVPSENLLDEIIKHVVKHNIDYFIFELNPEVLHEYNHIVALPYAKLK